MVFKSIQDDIAEVVDRFDNDIDEVMRRVSSLIAQWLFDNDINTTTSLTFDKAFNDMLTESGYYDVVNRFIDDDYDKLFPAIQSNLAIAGIATAYTASNLDNIMALKALDVNKFSILASTAGTSLKESLTKYAISNYTSDDMVKDIQEEFAGTNLYKHSKTIADTSISEFHQTVMDMKAEDSGVEYVYFYDGAEIDKVTRDYCKCILKANKYYKKSDMEKMKRDSRRKYNCRHYFYPVTEEYAKEEGFTKSDKARCR